ncbi:hypothetical protein BDN71DRAFT_1565682, partial [Pleurotus eryngii]
MTWVIPMGVGSVYGWSPMRGNHHNFVIHLYNKESDGALLAKIKNQVSQIPLNNPTSPIADMIKILKTPSPKCANMQLVQCWMWNEYTAAKNARKGNTNNTGTQEKKGNKMLWKNKQKQCGVTAEHSGMTWGQVDLKTHSEFSKVMSMNYPELTYCKGTWKMDQLASIDYPSWHSNHVVSQVKIEAQLNNTTLLKHSASPTTMLAKKQCMSPSPVSSSSSSSSSSQQALVHLDNPLVNLFPATAPPISPTTGQSMSPILLEYALLPLQDPTTDSNVNAPVPSPVNPAEPTTPSISKASTQLPTTFGASLSALRMMIPSIPYTWAMETLSQPVPGASAKTEGAKPINNLVKKSHKVRCPPVNYKTQ